MNVEAIPRVSVIVPMKNAETFIIAALNSVLSEKEVPIEVVVINDKSTDRSLEKVLGVSDERIRIIEGPGVGISACINAGLDAAKGDVVMRCDADDFFPAGRINIQLAWLDANPEYGAVCGGFSTMDKAGRLVANLATGDMVEEITDELNLGITRTTLCSFAIRKNLVESLGGFRPYFVTAEDIDFQLRLGEVARVMYLPQSFYLYRLHDASITHTLGNHKQVFFEIIARKFQSQRKAIGQDELQRGCPPMVPDMTSDKPELAAQHIQGMLMGAAWREHAAGNRGKAISLGFRALRQSPVDLGLWKSLLALLVKPAKKIC